MEKIIDREDQLEEQESDDLYEHQRIVVDKGQSLLRLDKFLTDKMERVSRNRIQVAIKNGAVRVDDKVVKANHLVKPEQVITLVLPRPPREDSKVLAEPIPLEILFEDDQLLIVNKPAGLVVHPGTGNWTGTLLNALAWYLHPERDNLHEGAEVENPALVHRIDKDTSGIMVVPKTEHAASHLAKQFYDHTINRTYQALVWGEPDPAEGTVEGYIARHPKNRLIYAAMQDDEGVGKFAVTHYKTIEPMYYVSLMECTLETGRTHQIRVHMQSLGHPLFSDEKYGGSQIRKGTVFTKYKQFVQNCFKILPRQALHAKSLGFIHPTTGDYMHFESELPEDMANALDKWRSYLQSRKSLLEDEGE